MAYSGPPNWDEFNDESINAFWTNINYTGNCIVSEIPAGYLKASFSGDANSSRVLMDQDAEDSFTPITAGTPWEINFRFYVPSEPYEAVDPGYGTDTFKWRRFEWSFWDNVLYGGFMLAWVYGGTPSGSDMKDHESCYIAEAYLDNEYDSEDVLYGPAHMTDRDIDIVQIIADKDHNGWFTFKWSIDASGVQKWELQPEGQDAVLDITPAGLTNYDLDIGGKGGWGWGWDQTLEENYGASYTGGVSEGPLYMDWVKESYNFITFTTTTTTTTTAPPFEASASQGGGADSGVVNEGFGGFGFGWG